ncbi:transcription initiation factor TFIID subunit 2-like [Hordeum vulgare subsp. vulgare]|uniref:transcription initiation factor TFIID subunit 2-like n=1 Tax=Hordeum vulgare subsp. vulgare TaxID=112509 RepID=UPI001D1A388D|nr:transcription initiation factor TFIID subunit 2-like [Hordeum vulgare subsp. vulgare]
MWPDSFRKILQMIVASTRASRTLSTKEFRHLVNKVGNLERPFLKEFFPRWIESCGCPIMRLGISYSKRRNLVELAVSRGCTAKADPGSDNHVNGDIQEGATGWPGMMSVRVHETGGAYDHLILPMAGEALHVVELQCHSKVAAKRFQKTKKGSKPDGSDDNVDASTQENRTSMDSPLLWIRVDPEMEYLAEIHFHQPIQMWINQLEKDKDVISQSQEITVLEKLPQLSFAVINALNNFLNDTKDTDLAGLLHLVKFYKSHRFDTDIGLPRPNDFHDIPEYFVLEEEMAIVIHTILFLAGINTLLQVHFGTRLPAVMAGSYTYIYTVVAIIISPRYVLFIGAPFERFVYTMRSLQGALIIAGVFEAVIGFFGIWRVFIRLSSDSSLPHVVGQ